jgi:hypothetical protein
VKHAQGSEQCEKDRTTTIYIILHMCNKFSQQLERKNGNGNFCFLKFKHPKIAGFDKTVLAKGGLSNKFAECRYF